MIDLVYPSLAPSVLSADLLSLRGQVKEVESNGADLIHVDVMDGHFVPNLTFGPVMVTALSRVTDLPLDVHLMITHADRFIDEFVSAGADIVTVHQEANVHLHRVLQMIREAGASAGVSLNPATDISTISPVLEELDLILVMSVNPGFGGQKFLDLALPKIESLAEMKARNGFRYHIEIDGGVNTDTAGRLVNAGAEVFVAGSAVFGASDVSAACRELKSVLKETRDRR